MDSAHPIHPRISPIPAGHRTVTPYLLAKDPEELIAFVVKAFGAVETVRHQGADGVIMHAELRIGDSMVMLGCATEQWPAMTAAIHLYVEDADAVYQRALDAGAISIMQLADQFYGDRSGGVKDALGNVWWIATHQEDVSEAEFTKRAAAMRH